MNYEILETHIVFENKKLTEIAVLWNDNGFVRATYSNLNPKAGCPSINSSDSIGPSLFQRVAGGGTYVDEARRKKYFPGKRKWSR
jgi:hypothetical protein